MGFRDLHSFNLALLAKQCWRPITNPDSLCTRILKAKYYPNCDLLQVGPKKDPHSHGRALLLGLQHLREVIFGGLVPAKKLTFGLILDPLKPI